MTWLRFVGRHRDKYGEISEKGGNTLVRTLRKIYGLGFASASGMLTSSLKVLSTQPEHASLTQLRKHHAEGALEGKIAAHS